MGTPEILLLTGSAVAACALFVLGVLAGMLVANRAADRAHEQQQAELEQAERERQQRLLAQQHEQEHARMPSSARARPRPVSLTDADPTREIDVSTYGTGPRYLPDTGGKRHHRRYE